MSRTSTSSSWSSAKVLASTSSGSSYSPANISWYALATRRGVSVRPSRSGSSPIAYSSSRTAASARSRSKLPRPGTEGPRNGKGTASTSLVTRSPDDLSGRRSASAVLAGFRPAWAARVVGPTTVLGLRPVPLGVLGPVPVLAGPLGRRPLLAARQDRRPPVGWGAVVRRYRALGVVVRTAGVRLVGTGRVARLRRASVRRPAVRGGPAVRTGLAGVRTRIAAVRAGQPAVPAADGADRGRFPVLLTLRRPHLAALLRPLGGALDGWLVRRGAPAEVVERRDPGPLGDVGEDPLEVLAGQRLLLQQLEDQVVQHVAVGVQDLPGLGVRGLDERAHLLVDLVRDLERVVRRVAHGPAQERVALVLAVAHRAEPRAHAVLGDHRAGDLGGLVDVAGRARGRLVEDQLLGAAATHREDQAADHLRARHQALVVLGHDERVPTGATPGQDRELVDGLQVGHRPGGQRVPTLVVGGELALQLRDDLALAPRPADHPVDRFLEVRGVDHGAVLPGGEQGRLVDHVREVGAGHAHGALGQRVQVGVRPQRLALGVHLQDGASAGQVGRADRDLPVEAAGP